MPRLLDLFCGAGGCAVGYERAGFEVTGLDIKAHQDFPYELIVEDVLEWMQRPNWHEGYDVIHASPPCPRYSQITNVSGNPEAHPDLVPVMIEALSATRKPWIIENVPGAPMPGSVTLCGSAFGLRVRRHRQFLSNVPLNGTVCDHKAQGRAIGVYGNPTGSYENQLARYKRIGRDYGLRAHSVADAQDAMGITWMKKWDDLTDAIPPAYTHYIGQQIMSAYAK
jgi:DNA (cytosine-5)-methyltransferase 1